MEPQRAETEGSTLGAYRELLVQEPRDVRRLLLVSLMLVLASALELLGVGLVLPFVHVLDRDASSPPPRMLAPFFEITGARTLVAQVATYGIVLIGVFVLKNLYLAFTFRVHMRFIHEQLSRVAREMLAGYLAMPYDSHLTRNSAVLLRMVGTSVNDVYRLGVPALLMLAAETMTASVLVVFLLVLEPVAILVTGFSLGLLAYLAQRRYRRQITHLGAVYRDAHSELLQWANQAISGVKDTKAVAGEAYFVERFADAVDRQGESLTRFRIMSLVPRFLLESLAVAALVAIALLVLVRGGHRERVVALLGVLAIALVRLLPSLTRMIAALGDARYYGPVAHEIASELRSFREHVVDSVGDTEPLPLRRELKLHGVCYSYPKAAAPALAGISLSLRAGEAVALVGPSGAGKTTLVDVLIGLLTPSAGTITVDGVAIDTSNVRAWRRTIGYVPQQVYLTDDSLRRNVAFGVDDSRIDEGRLQSAIAAAQLDDLIANLPQGLETRVGDRGVRLSGGQRQRLGIARALYRAPTVLVLDEATSALDGVTEREVVQAIEQLRGKCTLVVVAHRLSTVRSCDRLYFIDAARIEGAGTWDDLVASNSEFRALVAHAGV